MGHGAEYRQKLSGRPSVLQKRRIVKRAAFCSNEVPRKWLAATLVLIPSWVFADAIKGGAPVNGLRLGVESPVSSATADQIPGFRVTVRNVSDQPLILLVPDSFIACKRTLKGLPLGVSRRSAFREAAMDRKRHRLKPVRQRAKIAEKRVRANANGARLR